MKQTFGGTVLSCIGGLFSVLRDDGEIISCRARGNFKRNSGQIVSGDKVELTLESGDSVISGVFPRKNIFIRPPLSNLTTLFITFSPKHPQDDTLFIDKLFSVAVHNGVTPVAVITKSDLDAERASALYDTYTDSGFTSFITSSYEHIGENALKSHILSSPKDSVFAFCGMSGVGKSSLMNLLFPYLDIKTGTLSERVERGKNTTRATTLYPLENGSFVADTPGFSMLDFINFNFFELSQLADTFPDISSHLGECRYRDCTHTGEDGCAVAVAAQNNIIKPSRYKSYLAMYAELKQKPKVY